MFCIWKKQIIFARKMHGTVLSHQNCLRNIHVEKRIQISLILFYLVNLFKPVQFVNNKKLEIKYGLLWARSETVISPNEK